MRYIIVALVLAMPTTLAAQRLEPAGVTTAHALPAGGDQAPRAQRLQSELPIRMLLGLGGALGGAYAGALVGVAVPHPDCGCDDPGLEQAILGAMVGSVLAPAVLSAVPGMSSECTFAKRAGIGILGGVAGAAIGGVLGASAARGGGVVIGYVGGAGVGAALGSGLCRA